MKNLNYLKIFRLSKKKISRIIRINWVSWKKKNLRTTKNHCSIWFDKSNYPSRITSAWTVIACENRIKVNYTCKRAQDMPLKNFRYPRFSNNCETFTLLSIRINNIFFLFKIIPILNWFNLSIILVLILPNNFSIDELNSCVARVHYNESFVHRPPLSIFHSIVIHTYVFVSRGIIVF